MLYTAYDGIICPNPISSANRPSIVRNDGAEGTISLARDWRENSDFRPKLAILRASTLRYFLL